MPKEDHIERLLDSVLEMRSEIDFPLAYKDLTRAERQEILVDRIVDLLEEMIVGNIIDEE